MQDYTYFSIEAELETYRNNTAAVKAVLAKFPDVGRIVSNHTSMILETGDFYSPSIVKDEVKLRFGAGVWHNFCVTPYVEVPYEYGIAEVYNDPLYYTLCNFHSPSFKSHLLPKVNRLTKKEYFATWKNSDQEILQKGYSSDLLKPIYNEFLLRLSRDETKVELIREGLPKYILDHLPFL